MLKKILSLILSGVLLLQSSCFFTFIENTYGFSIGAEPEKPNICINFPLNKYNQTADTECAFRKVLDEQRATNGTALGVASQVGPNGEHEVRIWDVKKIRAFAQEMWQIILLRNKDTLKNDYMESLLNTTNKFLSLNSTEEADRVTKKLLDKSPYLKNDAITTGITSMLGMKITPNEIESWKQTHEKRVEEYKEECNWFETFFSSLCEKKVNKKIKGELTDGARKAELRAIVYSSVVDNVIYAISNKNYEGQDALIARLDFSGNDYNSRVYFDNIGLGKNKEIRYKDVKPILDYVGNNYKNDKEDL